jgi:cell division protein ZapA
VAKNTYTMTVFGSSFTLRSDDDVQHLRSVADYFSRCVKEIEAAVPTESPLRIAVLSALNIADELLKERGARRDGSPVLDRDTGEIEEIAQRLIASIDETLEESSGTL